MNGKLRKHNGTAERFVKRVVRRERRYVRRGLGKWIRVDSSFYRPIKSTLFSRRRSPDLRLIINHSPNYVSVQSPDALIHFLLTPRGRCKKTRNNETLEIVSRLTRTHIEHVQVFIINNKVRLRLHSGKSGHQ